MPTCYWRWFLFKNTQRWNLVFYTKIANSKHATCTITKLNIFIWMKNKKKTTKKLNKTNTIFLLNRNFKNKTQFTAKFKCIQTIQLIHKPLFPVIKSELLVLDIFCLNSDYNGGKMNVYLFVQSHTLLAQRYINAIHLKLSLSTAHTKDLIIVWDRQCRFMSEHDMLMNLLICTLTRLDRSLSLFLRWLLVLPFLNKRFGECFHFVFIGIRETTGERDDSYLRITNNSSPFC